MPLKKQKPFSELLIKFKKSLSSKKKEAVPKIILIILANTHDKILSKDCEKDMRSVKTAFKKVADHFDVAFFSIQVAGKHYKWENLITAIDAIEINNHSGFDSQIIFYYTGHGFSYQNDRFKKFPQMDIRPHNNQADFNNINFIKKHTINVEVVLDSLRVQGCRVNIAIADCCNNIIPYKRQRNSEDDMFGFPLPPKIRKITRKVLTDDNKEICILIGSSQLGQAAISDGGSIFTKFFTKAISDLLESHPKGEMYIPWVKILKNTSARAFKESKGYDAGDGKRGNQKAVFEVYSDRYLNPD
jgi:hypothetical protein